MSSLVLSKLSGVFSRSYFGTVLEVATISGTVWTISVLHRLFICVSRSLYFIMLVPDLYFYYACSVDCCCLVLPHLLGLSPVSLIHIGCIHRFSSTPIYRENVVHLITFRWCSLRAFLSRVPTFRFNFPMSFLLQLIIRNE